MTEPFAAIAAADTAAWNSGPTAAVVSFHAGTGGIAIDRGTPWKGCAGVQAMAAGLFADVADLTLTGDGLRVAGSKERDIDANDKVGSSGGWFDATDHARRVAG